MKASEARGSPGPGRRAEIASRLLMPSTPRDHVIGILALLVLLLATRPFPGIIHDATLYAVQALKAQANNALGQDLFFHYGNQGQFSLFGAIWHPAVARLGLAPASALFWALGLTLWLAALIALTRTIFNGQRIAYVAAGFVLALNPGYGNGVLGYAESFVTSRPFAEAFSLLALAALWRRQFLLGGASLLVASAFHPLVGVSAIIVGTWVALRSWKRYALLVAVGSLAALAMAFAGVAPFTWLFEQYDPAWSALTHRIDTIVYPSSWLTSMALTTAALPATVLVITSLKAEARLARFSAALLILAGLGLGLAVLGSDLLSNRLITSLQFWRVLLYMTVFGNMLAAPLLADGQLAPRSKVLLAFAAVFAVVETSFGMITIGSAAIAASALAIVAFETLRRRPLRPWQHAAALLPAVGGSLLSLSFIAHKLLTAPFSGPDIEILTRLAFIALAMAALLRAPGHGPGGKLLAPLLLLSFVALSAISDHRDATRKFIDSDTPIPPQAASLIRDKTVYWEEGLHLLWFKLRVPSFYNCTQKGGIAFFRTQAFEFERRALGLRGLNTRDFDPHPVARCPTKANLKENGPTHRAQIETACSALPGLDILVLRNAPTDAPATLSFTLPIPGKDNQPETTFHIYDCAGFRSG